MLAKLATWWSTTPTTEILWLGLGFLAQLLFATRFIVQWLASEKARRSIVPETLLRDGVVDYLVKPVDGTRLTAAVGQAMERRDMAWR